MPLKKIVAIGIELASDEIDHCNFDADISLLDYDLIIFEPAIKYGHYDYSTYQGKPSLNEDASFRAANTSSHWRREIKEAVENGKTVFVFLSKKQEVTIDTGERSYSGTGRNRQTTRHVTEFNSHKCIPVNALYTNRSGTEIKPTPMFSEVVASYWEDFAKYSEYRVVLEGDKIPACFATKSGDKPVGAIYQNQSSGGSLVLLPHVDFNRPEFSKTIETDDGDEEHWSKLGVSYSKKMIKSLIQIDKALKTHSQHTPEPLWVRDKEMSLKKERILRADLLRLEGQLTKLEREKEDISKTIQDVVQIKALLFETGKALELAIIKALKILGFKAEQYNDGDSEFDAIFESKEGRLLGEAEGKDNKPINITKLRQLSLNIHEDLAREDVDEPAKGVLFGNAFRLQSPSDRNAFFTDKCLSSSSALSIALVSTVDLFFIARYLLENKDANFARKCRQTIVSTSGEVVFPALPRTKIDTDKVSSS